MKLPPEGICVPCVIVRVRDGDTIEVRLRTGQVAAIRLLDCWAAEMSTIAGRQAKAFVESLIERHDGTGQPCYVWIPLVRDADRDGVLDLTELLRGFTFDRILACVFLGDADLSELIVAAGHATRTKRAPSPTPPPVG